MPECDMSLDSKHIIDDQDDIDESTLFAAVKVMRRPEAELLKRRIEEASSASPSTIRLLEEACATQGDAHTIAKSVKPGCFLRTRIPFKKFTDYAIIPIKKGGKPRNVVITRQKSQISQQLASVVAAKKAHFFGDSPDDSNKHAALHTSPRQKSPPKVSSLPPNAKSDANRFSQSHVASPRRAQPEPRVSQPFNDDELDDEDDDAYTAPWCTEAARTRLQTSAPKRDQPESDAERTSGLHSDAENGDEYCKVDDAQPRSSRRLDSSTSILRCAMRRKAVANEASWRTATLGNRSRPRYSPYTHIANPRSMMRASWFSVPSVRRGSSASVGPSTKYNAGASVARSFFEKTHSRLTSRPMFAGVASVRFAAQPRSIDSTALSRSESPSPALHGLPSASEGTNVNVSAACSFLFGSSSVAKQQRRPNAVPTILQRGRTSLNVNVPKRVAQPPRMSPPQPIEVNTPVEPNTVVNRAETQLQKASVLPNTSEAAPVNCTNANLVGASTRPLTASELFKQRMKTAACLPQLVRQQSAPGSGSGSTPKTGSTFNRCDSNSTNTKTTVTVPATQRESVHTVPVPVPAPGRKPMTVLELLRYKQAMSKADPRSFNATTTSIPDVTLCMLPADRSASTAAVSFISSSQNASVSQSTAPDPTNAVA